jgi:DNA-binding MarR family transcriptional regulator
MMVTGSAAAADVALPSKLATSTGFLLGKAAQRAQVEFEQRLKPFKLRSRDYGVLVLIRTQGPRSQQYIGEALRIDRTTMVGVIDDLERRGLVQRVRDPDDRRRYAVSLTDKARELVEGELVGIDAEVNAELTTLLSEAEHKRLNALLVKLLGEPGRH